MEVLSLTHLDDHILPITFKELIFFMPAEYLLLEFEFLLAKLFIRVLDKIILLFEPFLEQSTIIDQLLIAKVIEFVFNAAAPIGRIGDFGLG
jgi:hypothetical protein